jgi:hypothetical protein
VTGFLQKNLGRLVVLGLACGLTTALPAWAQRPYIGFAYPAGGQQGATVQVQLGGQGLDNVDTAWISGSGVTISAPEYVRQLNNREMSLLKEQLQELKGGTNSALDMMEVMTNATMMIEAAEINSPVHRLMGRIERRMASTSKINQPASMAIASVSSLEITIAPDAPCGEREIRLVTPKGISNPLTFMVGQLPEVSRKPMMTSQLSILGKEEESLRKRPASEVEDRITLPCTANGQIASGEINRYRFEARKGQRLVMAAEARQLIPYIADAVPGWVQPVLELYDANGKELAYDDDYRFKPDPVIFYEVPKDGEYVIAIRDSIYRGREDFVYRVSAGELPFVTSIFPLGGRAGEVMPKIQVAGWNLEGAEIEPLPTNTPPGISRVTARCGACRSNLVPFALDTLPECFEKELNNTPARAQKVELPVIINGRVDPRGDLDVFQFKGKAGDSVVAEVQARRLDSTLDSVLKLTDEAGAIVAFNDDREDPGSGLNTHHADSYILAKLPADGSYFIELRDTAGKGGEDYGYRLRISAPQPDFALRAVPSGIMIPSRSLTTNETSKAVSTGAVTYTAQAINVIRKDDFAGPIKLGLREPPAGISAAPVVVAETQTVGKISIKCALVATQGLVNLVLEGRAMVDGVEVVHEAVPAEDRMQAFLWRHLVPAQEFRALVAAPPPPNRQDKGSLSNFCSAASLPTGLVLYCNFDQAPGGNGRITDKSGLNHGGRVTGARWTAYSKQGGAMTFGVSNDCITVTNNGDLNLKTMTISAWFKTARSEMEPRGIIDQRGGYALGIAGGSTNTPTRDRLVFAINRGHRCYSDKAITDGSWHHVAATFDGSVMTLVVDGVAQTSGVPCEEAVAENPGDLFIGLDTVTSDGEGRFKSFNGMIGDVMLFSRALSFEEIQGVLRGSVPCKFTRQEVSGQLDQLKRFYSEGLLSEKFYNRKVAECEIAVDVTATRTNAPTVP